MFILERIKWNPFTVAKRENSTFKINLYKYLGMVFDIATKLHAFSREFKTEVTEYFGKKGDVFKPSVNNARFVIEIDDDDK